MASQTMLEWLRTRSMVDCDTMDVEGITYPLTVPFGSFGLC